MWPDAVEQNLVEVFKYIENRSDMFLSEIGADEAQLHFSIQRLYVLSGREISETVRSIKAKEFCRLHSEVNQLYALDNIGILVSIGRSWDKIQSKKPFNDDFVKKEMYRSE